jgi:hypothetical protein
MIVVGMILLAMIFAAVMFAAVRRLKFFFEINSPKRVEALICLGWDQNVS